MDCSEWVASKRACHNMATCSKCQQRCWPFQSEGEWHAPSCELLAWRGPHARTTTVGHYGGMEGFSHKGGLRIYSLVHHVDWGHGLLGLRWKASMAYPGINIRLAPQNNLRSQGGIGCYTLKPFWGNLGIVLRWLLKLPHFFFPWGNISVVPTTS
jgi:hypothetical protein